MIYYSDNPNLGHKTVTNYKGDVEYRINCRKIKHQYYIKNKDCFEIEGLWYRINSGLIIFDYEINKWVLKSKINDIIRGVVAVDPKTEEIILGYYTPNNLKNIKIVHYPSSNTYDCISLDALKPLKVYENLSNGCYYIKVNSIGVIGSLNIKRNVVNNQNQPYNIEDNANLFKKSIDVYNSYNMPIESEIIKYSKLLGNITFGAEFETIRGYMPKHIQYQNGLIVCRDGSLKDPVDGSQGAEFTTIPLQGAKGVQTLKNICKSLTDRCDIDKKCSLHFHIGNIPTNKLSLISLYNLCRNIQDELFEMFPFYKRDEVKYAAKNKNYCQKLNSLSILKTPKTKDEYENYVYVEYLKLFKFLSCGYLPDKIFNRKTKKHPKQHKWDRHSRYYWINLLNTIFSDRNTVEFRLHEGTMNFTKVFSWLLICNAIVKYSEKHKFEILKNNSKISLFSIFDYYNSFGKEGVIVSDYLKEYYRERVVVFSQYAAKRDYVSSGYIDSDNSYKTKNTSLSKFFNYE